MPKAEAALQGQVGSGSRRGRQSKIAPSAACRFYRQLYTSGRLYLIYQALFNHFEACSGTSLSALLESGSFISTGRELILSPSNTSSWQARTALLFLQLACQSLKKIVREKDRRSNPRSPLFHLATYLESPLLSPRPALADQHSEISQARSAPSFREKEKLIDKIPDWTLFSRLQTAEALSRGITELQNCYAAGKPNTEHRIKCYILEPTLLNLEGRWSRSMENTSWTT